MPAALDLEAYADRLGQRVASTGADIVESQVSYVVGDLAAEVTVVADLPGNNRYCRGVRRSHAVQVKSLAIPSRRRCRHRIVPWSEVAKPIVAVCVCDRESPRA